MARNDDFRALAQGLRPLKERVQRKRPDLHGVERFVEHIEIGVRGRRAFEQFPLPREAFRALLLVHLPEELAGAVLCAQQNGVFKTLQRLSFAALCALQELTDAHAKAVAQRPQRQPQRRCGLALAVAEVDMYKSMRSS